MWNRNKKRKAKTKEPSQKFPIDSKVPKHKIPSEKIPKQKIMEEIYSPPKKQKTKKKEQKPARSTLKESRFKNNQKPIPKEKIVTKTPKGQKFKYTARDSKSIPKQKIPESKIPKQDKFTLKEPQNYIPQDEASKKKKKESEKGKNLK